MFAFRLIAAVGAPAMSHGVWIQGNPMSQQSILLLLLVVAPSFFYGYYFPSFEARRRGHPDQLRIEMCNLFLGWTGVGWFMALAWATRKAAEPNDSEGTPI